MIWPHTRGMTFAIGLTLILLIAGSTMPVSAEWQYLDFTGHWYDAVYVEGGITWSEAKAAAEAAGGYLATIHSDEENLFAYDLASDSTYWERWLNNELGPFLGGYQPEGAAEPDGGWAWVTGEAWSYEAWAPMEPDDSEGGEQNSLHYLGRDGYSIRYQWNDWNGDTGVVSYIMERNTDPSGAPAGGDDSPELATWVLIACTVAVGALRRRRG